MNNWLRFFAQWFSLLGVTARFVCAQQIISLGPSRRFPMSVTFGTYPMKRNNHIQFLNPAASFTSGSQSCQHLTFGKQLISLRSTGFAITMTFAFTGNSKSSETILDFGSGSSIDGIVLQRSGSSGNLVFSVFPSTGGSPVFTIQTSQTFAQNTIYNFALTYNNVSNQLMIYVNGVLSQTVAASSLADRVVTNTFIGRSHTETSPCFNGMIFQLNVWNVLLNSTDVQRNSMDLALLSVTPQISADDAFVQVAPEAITPNYFSNLAYPQFGKTLIRFENPNLLSNSPSCQYLDFGTQFLAQRSKGFTVTATIRFTGAPQYYERVFDFANGIGNANFLLTREQSSPALKGHYFSAGGDSFFYTSTNNALYVSQNVIYNIAVIYNPNVGTFGEFSFWLYGAKILSVNALVASADRNVLGTFVGRSQWTTSDYCTNMDIFSLKTFNRVLNATEIMGEALNTDSPVIRIRRNQTSDFVTSTSPPLISSRGSIFNASIQSDCPNLNFGSQMMSLGISGYSATLVFDATNSLAFETNWTCVNNGSASDMTPVRLNSGGTIECMSADGVNCFWTTVMATCQGWATSPPANINGSKCFLDSKKGYCLMGKHLHEAETLFDLSNPTGTNRVFLTRIRRTNEITFGYQVDSSIESLTTILPVTRFNRYNLGVVYNRTNDQMSIWLNGSRLDFRTATRSGKNFFYSNSYVGRSMSGSGQCFSGVIYSLNIYDRVVTAAEMRNDFPAELCPFGQGFNELNNECTHCFNGFYKPAIGNGPCLACPANASCVGTPSVNFTCNAGFTISPDAQSCTACMAGEYKSVSGNGPCRTCPFNSNCAGRAFVNFACNPGFTISSDAQSCVACLAGEYKSTIGNGPCLSCPSNANCSSMGFACDPGYTLGINLLGCEKCHITSYKPLPGNGACLPCPLNADCSTGVAFTCPASYLWNMTANSCVSVPSFPPSVPPPATPTYVPPPPPATPAPVPAPASPKTVTFFLADPLYMSLFIVAIALVFMLGLSLAVVLWRQKCKPNFDVNTHSNFVNSVISQDNNSTFSGGVTSRYSAGSRNVSSTNSNIVNMMARRSSHQSVRAHGNKSIRFARPTSVILVTRKDSTSTDSQNTHS